MRPRPPQVLGLRSLPFLVPGTQLGQSRCVETLHQVMNEPELTCLPDGHFQPKTHTRLVHKTDSISLQWG